MSNSPFDPNFQNTSIDSKIVAALERISEAFRVLLWNESKAHGLSPIQVQVLIFLLYHSEEKCKVSYLANEFNMTKATISDTVKTLERKGLIEKEYVAEDTRSYIIKLTDTGKTVASETSAFSQEIKTPIDKLAPEQKEVMLQSLISVIKQLNNSGIVTVQRMCFSCTHYKADHEGQAHYCSLLEAKLTTSELRIDCPEHQLG